MSDEVQIQQARELRLSGDSYVEIAESLGVDVTEVVEMVRSECEADVDVAPVDDKPWEDTWLVHELFIERNMYFTEMADLLECHSETARKAVRRVRPRREVVEVERRDGSYEFVGRLFEATFDEGPVEFVEQDGVTLSVEDGVREVRAWVAHEDIVDSGDDVRVLRGGDGYCLVPCTTDVLVVETGPPAKMSEEEQGELLRRLHRSS